MDNFSISKRIVKLKQSTKFKNENNKTHVLRNTREYLTKIFQISKT